MLIPVKMFTLPTVFCLFALNAGAQNTSEPAQYTNAKLKRGNRRLHSILVSPPQITVTQAGVSGSSNSPAEATRIGTELFAVVKNYLKSQGASIVEPITSQEDPQLAEIQARYDSIDPQMVKHPKGVIRARYTLSDVVAAYPPAASADTLVFVRGNAYVTSRLEKVISTVPGPWAWVAKDQYFNGRIAFVDAHSGEVLLLLVFTTYGHGWRQSVEELLPRIKEAARLMSPPIHTVVGQ